MKAIYDIKTTIDYEQTPEAVQVIYSDEFTSQVKRAVESLQLYLDLSSVILHTVKGIDVLYLDRQGVQFKPDNVTYKLSGLFAEVTENYVRIFEQNKYSEPDEISFYIPIKHIL